MKTIAAIDRDRNIGYKSGLLFKIPADMKFFKEHTVGKAVVMGRKTLESLPGSKPLGDRVNIVLTRNADYAPEGVIIAHDTDELFRILEAYDTDKVYIIGGESVYRLLLPFCDTAILTEIDTVAEKADKKFPELDPDEWSVESQTETQESNGYKFRWKVYKRK